MKDLFKLLLCHSLIRTPNYELITIQVYKLMRISIHSIGVKKMKYIFHDFFSSCLFLVNSFPLKNQNKYGRNTLVLCARSLIVFGGGWEWEVGGGERMPAY